MEDGSGATTEARAVEEKEGVCSTTKRHEGLTEISVCLDIPLGYLGERSPASLSGLDRDRTKMEVAPVGLWVGSGSDLRYDTSRNQEAIGGGGENDV